MFFPVADDFTDLMIFSIGSGCADAFTAGILATVGSTVAPKDCGGRDTTYISLFRRQYFQESVWNTVTLTWYDRNSPKDMSSL